VEAGGKEQVASKGRIRGACAVLVGHECWRSYARAVMREDVGFWVWENQPVEHPCRPWCQAGYPRHPFWSEQHR